jgi:ribosomal protein S18 acetylase RimI-like enzyme
MSVTVREVTSDDRAALVRMLERIEQFKPDEVAVALELVDASLHDAAGSGYECLVAVDSSLAREGSAPPDGASGVDSLVGYICVGPTPMTEATWDLYWIAVDPGSQGRGIGQQLYAAFAERAIARGARQVRIETSSKESYAATGGFYERLNFSIDGRLRDFYADGDDLLIFYRRIA